MKVIETERLILRTWEQEDVDDYYRINQDPKVIEFLLGPLTIQEVKDFMAAMNEQFAKLNFTLFAVEAKLSGNLIGFIGLNPPNWQSHFSPCVEIGWRLGSQYWHQGYATEGAKAVLDYGFNRCHLTEIVSFTVPANIRSIRVMEKIGMQRDVDGDFAHPKLASDHKLSKHVLYKIKRPC
jgi:RimJ/RimL family protein N-acetyltransferase